VELQLCHAPEIKGNIDRAWGVVHNKHKKNQTPFAPLDPVDPKSQENLQLLPIGQDAQRIRYWIADGPCTFTVEHLFSFASIFAYICLEIFNTSLYFPVLSNLMVLLNLTIFSDSPRLYTSTNPWKITATFHTISSTREEYIATIDSLKASAPPEPKKGQKRTKLEQSHLALIAALEKRIEAIDGELNVSNSLTILRAEDLLLLRLRNVFCPPHVCAELILNTDVSNFTLSQRVHKVRKKIEQRRMLLAQAEVRQTRTRRQTQKPDYVYNDEMDSEASITPLQVSFFSANLLFLELQDDGGDEYTYQDEDGRDEEYERQFMNEANGLRKGRAGSSTVAPRRSTRTSTMNANGKRESSSDSWLWRSERRSSRLAGGEAPLDVEPPRKRARTEESTSSTHSNDVTPPENHGTSNGVRVKTVGAAALKPTEIALEQIAGKKRSKFWVYAIEPIPGAAPPPADSSLTNEEVLSDVNGRVANNDSSSSHSPEANYLPNKLDYNRSLEGSFSPMNSP